jgi:hypothetical protein
MRLVLLNTVFGNQPSLKLPEMTQLFADPQLTTLAVTSHGHAANRTGAPRISQ